VTSSAGIPSFFRSTGFPGYLERTRDFAEKIEKEKRKREKEKKKNNRPVSFLSTPRTNSRFAKGKKKKKKRKKRKERNNKKREKERDNYAVVISITDTRACIICEYTHFKAL